MGIRAEGSFLFTYVRVYAEHCVEENYRNKAAEDALAGRAKVQIKRGAKEEAIALAEKVMDWKSYRIPTKYRKAIVNRYYMVMLHKRRIGKQRMFIAVANMIKCQKELMDFLKLFGADDDRQKVIEDIDKDMAG